MLTKTDLKEIDKVLSKRIRTEIEVEGKNTRDELKSDILTSRMRLHQELSELSNRLKNLEISVNNGNKDIHKEFKKLNGKFIELFDFLDRDQLKILKRVEKIEGHLKLEPATL